MKRLILAAVAAMSLFTATDNLDAQDVWVNGYMRSNGTYVTPHYRTRADGNFWNNYSTYPNINPYTGRMGTRITPPSNYGGYRSYSYPSYGYSNLRYRYPSYSYRSNYANSWSRFLYNR